MSCTAGFVLQADGRWMTTKAPGDELYYGRDIAARFPGRTIASAEIVGDPVAVTATDLQTTDTEAIVLVSGGNVGQVGSVHLRCTLDSGEVTDLTLWFKIV